MSQDIVVLTSEGEKVLLEGVATDEHTPCPVCLKLTDKRKTCSKECSKLWQSARYMLDQDARESHKVSRSKSILANQGKYSPGAVSWAERYRDGRAKTRKPIGPTSDRSKAIMAQINTLRGLSWSLSLIHLRGRNE